MQPHGRLVVRLVLLWVLAGCRPADSVERIDAARLVVAHRDSANWLTYGRTYSEQRFSPLRQISDSTVAQLGLVWSQELPTTRGLEATPIVNDGVIYTTSSWSLVYAFDANSGRQLWMYDPKVIRSRTRTVCCDVVNRGLALYRGKLFVGTLDGRLIAISARTGLRVWEALTVEDAFLFALFWPKILIAIWIAAWFVVWPLTNWRGNATVKYGKESSRNHFRWWRPRTGEGVG